MEKKFYTLYLKPLRSDFAQTMTAEERNIMLQHAAYWTEYMNQGVALVFGLVMDPKEAYGLGVIAVDDEDQVKNLIENDPAGKINRYEYYPMRAKAPGIK